MSKGSKIIRVRVSDGMMAQIAEDLSRKNRQSQYGGMDLSWWLRDAIREKLSHGRRSREKRSPSRWLGSQLSVRDRWRCKLYATGRGVV